MPNYQFIVTVQETRAYTINATTPTEAEEILREDINIMDDFDVVEREVDSMELQDD